jgi:hypothetical protein
MPKRKSPQLPLEQYEPGQYPPGGFVRTEEYPNGVHVRANGRPDPRKGKLTGRQETFCRLIVEVKTPSPPCFALFPGSVSIDLAQKPWTEVQGQRFDTLSALWDALRADVRGHYARIASCAP